ncbi:aminoacyl-histidine dipeptidase [Candidatus Vecturithrix granuli]|uniref:Cytosol non-specific dipeptidase n=1 Tax=Vecturithrix granuli TaxID=1499967 RepID=A0A081C817_VECG1|nr:aminoacyl-histidine dipeptidase [Candidatus Vecturithrix granuli]
MHKKTEHILKIFEELSKIPRCSGNEGAVRAWLLNWAKERELEAQQDAIGNVLINVPGSKGYESSPTVALQGHLDMVCEKLPESTHDFSQDAIQLVYHDEWLSANGTTLGADNGIAIAIALALATDEKVSHPPLELFFTVEEETGMTGVKGLEPDALQAKRLINLDSEEEGTIIIGCAGSQQTELFLPLLYEDTPEGYRAYRLAASKMKGGHSGVEINAQRANAIQVIARMADILTRQGDLRFQSIQGGTVGNAIPRDAEAIIFFPEHLVDQNIRCVADVQNVLRSEYAQTDPELTLDLTAYAEVQDNRAMSAACTRKAVDFLLALPHGPAAMSAEIPEFVETSNNLAKVRVADGRLYVLSTQRSNVFSRQQAHTNRIEALARLAGAEAKSSEGSQPWEANWNSPLAEACRKVYKRRFRKEPKITIIHAGLECGMIGTKIAGMDMISFGPTIQNPHSPSERIHLASIGKVWDLLIGLLKDMK